MVDFCTKIQPKLNKLQKKTQKSTKIVKKRLFFGDFSNLIQFRLNINIKYQTYHGIDSWILLVILTPLATLGALK